MRTSKKVGSVLGIALVRSQRFVGARVPLPASGKGEEGRSLELVELPEVVKAREKALDQGELAL